jgi:hypothetical protein
MIENHNSPALEGPYKPLPTSTQILLNMLSPSFRSLAVKGDANDSGGYSKYGGFLGLYASLVPEYDLDPIAPLRLRFRAAY